MTLTIEIPAALEAILKEQAEAKGVTAAGYVRRVLEEDLSQHAQPECPVAVKRFDNLSDLLINSPFAGADLTLDRARDYPRPVDLG